MTGARLLPPPLEVALRRVVERAAFVVLLAGLLAATAIGRSRTATATPVAMRRPPTTSSTPASTATTAARIAAGRAATVEPSLPPPTTSTSAPARWPDARPPDTGTYAYVATIDGTSGPASLDVTDLGGARRDERLTVGDDAQDRTMQWSPTGDALLGNRSCAYAPALTELALPLARGRSWQSSATCSSGDGSLRLDETATVTGATMVLVRGARTPVWVIRRSSTTTATSAGGTIVSETRTTDLFAPGLGLVVYQTGKAARPDATGVVRTSEWTLQLAD